MDYTLRVKTSVGSAPHRVTIEPMLETEDVAVVEQHTLTHDLRIDVLNLGVYGVYHFFEVSNDSAALQRAIHVSNVLLSNGNNVDLVPPHIPIYRPPAWFTTSRPDSE